MEGICWDLRGCPIIGLSPSRLALRTCSMSAHVPPDMMVIVAESGKTFHVAGCPFIHDKSNLHTIPARETEKEGYAPCVRCMKKYLDADAIAEFEDDSLDDVAGSGGAEQKSE